MESKDLRAFVRRDWALKEDLKRGYWAERYAVEGPEATLAASAAMWEHLRQLCPSWPTPEDRAEDLRHHLDFIDKLRRAAHVFTDR